MTTPGSTPGPPEPPARPGSSITGAGQPPQAQPYPSPAQAPGQPSYPAQPQAPAQRSYPNAPEHGQPVTQAGREVAGTAAQAGREVAGTTREQAGAVAGEVRSQARNLAGEVREQATHQVEDQRERLAHTMHSLGDELRSMAQGSKQNGVAAEVAMQVSDRAHQFAGYLERRHSGDLLGEIRDYARRRPGRFLAGALAAGVVAGRLARGGAAAASAGDSTTGGSTATTPGTASRYAVREAPGPTQTPATSGPRTLAEEPLVQAGDEESIVTGSQYDPRGAGPMGRSQP